MDLWYARSESQGTSFCVKVLRPLFSGEGKAGRIDVLETLDFGRTLAIDGAIALTEADGFAHREMLVHTPLNVHPLPRAVLVVGGGDGGVVQELLRYPAVERIVLVEDDEVLLAAGKKYFPAISVALDDPRVRVESSEPEIFVRDTKERFDIIALGTSPGHGFGQSFYSDCFRLLSGDGILVTPSGSAFFPAKRRELVMAAGRLKRLFPIYRLYGVESPSSESGRALLAFASKKYDPLRDFDAEAWSRRELSTRYYDADVHRAAFALPRYVAEALQGA